MLRLASPRLLGRQDWVLMRSRRLKSARSFLYCNVDLTPPVYIDKRKDSNMDASTKIDATGPLSLRSAALIAGIGLLVMAFSAPFAHFYFMGQSVVPDNPAATVENFQTNGTPYLIGALLLFITYVMDVIVAWALYWYLRPGQRALAQLVAWARLVYTALAFMGLWAIISAYDLAVDGSISNTVASTVLQTEVLVQISTAKTMESIALFFFGVHLWLLSVLIWRSAHVPRWIAIVVGLAGCSYVILFVAKYFAPDLELGWVLLLALGELVFMIWLLAIGWRKQTL